MPRLDAHSKDVVGWALGAQRSTDPALPAWSRARRRLRRLGISIEGMIVHHDRDSVYTSEAWGRKLVVKDGPACRTRYAAYGTIRKGTNMVKKMKRKTISNVVALALLASGCGTAGCNAPKPRTEVTAVAPAQSFAGLEGMTAMNEEKHPEIDLENRVMPMHYSYLLDNSSNLRDYYPVTNPDRLFDGPSQSVAWVAGLYPDSLESITTAYTPEKGLSLLSNIRTSNSWETITSNTKTGENPRHSEAIKYQNLRLNGKPIDAYLNGKANIDDVPVETISISDQLVMKEYLRIEGRLGPQYKEGAGKESVMAVLRMSELAGKLRAERTKQFSSKNPMMLDVNPVLYLPVGSTRKNDKVEFQLYRLTYKEPSPLDKLLNREKT